MKCPKCGFVNPKYEKYCLNCNYQLKTDKKKNGSSGYRIFFYLIPALIVIGILAFVLIRFVFNSNQEEYIHPSGIDPSSLASVEFPSEESQYSQDWPADLTFPSDFILVDYSSGILPEGSKNGWSMKLRYDASPSQAEAAAISFLEDKGWQIVQNEPLDSIGYSILIQRGKSSGIVIIDIDPVESSNSIILSTIFE